MKVLTETGTVHNTGGNCMVYFVNVTGDDTIVQFGINDESIVAYSQLFEEIDDWHEEIIQFGTDDWKEVIDVFGSQVANDLYAGFKKQWEYTDFLKNSNLVNGCLYQEINKKPNRKVNILFWLSPLSGLIFFGF